MMLSEPGALALVGSFAAAAVRISSPLLIAAIGETVVERSGVINLGLEGAMLAGALAGAIGGSVEGPWFGLLLSAAAGMALMTVFATVTIWLRADQIIAGTAMTLAAVGLTGGLYRLIYGAGGVGLSLPTFAPVAIPVLSRVSVLGPMFQQPVPVYLGFLSVPLVWILLFRTRFGLALRAAGESPDAARAAGVPVQWCRTIAILFGGAMGGLAGATLVLAQVGTFAERMTAGRGFVAIAIVVLGRWHPFGVFAAALLFGLLTALQFLFQASGVAIPYQWFLMLPYVLTLLALAVVRRRVAAPAGLAKS
ncbi:MAG TPA: ABC transporter permease [Gemmatimonadales bacterium]|nr:ABC transporter permease [Gemmatimonadales bacterium]